MAHVTVRLSATLQPLAEGRSSIALEAGTVGDVLALLVADHPALRRPLLRVDGAVRESTAVFLNERELSRSGLADAPLADGDRLVVVAAAAGGSDGATAPPTGPRAPGLSREGIRRYSRHLLLPEVGRAGQERLRAGRVLVVGAGGLGSPAALYLAAAGVGTVGLVDADRVDLSNLQRQVLYASDDVGEPKVERAAARLRALNPDVEVRTYPEFLDASNALDVVEAYDVVVDGSDNFPTRYLLNDACVLRGKPDVFGSVYRFEGQATVFDARRGPCYRCLFPEPPAPELAPSCAEGGVLGVLPGLLGEVQATEALKLLLGIGEPLIGRLLLYDALELRFRELPIHRDPACVLTGDRPTQTGLVDYPAFCGVGAPVGDVPTVSPEALARELAGPDPPTLLDVRQPGEWELGHLPRATLIPRAELAERAQELSGARQVVVYCSEGPRSAAATRLLLDLGFTGVRHLDGGLRAWAERVDPTTPVY